MLNVNGDTKKCRGCGRLAAHGDGLDWKWCYYGGDVCSKSCDERACLELERSMPGHGPSQTRIGDAAKRNIEMKWSTQ